MLLITAIRKQERNFKEIFFHMKILQISDLHLGCHNYKLANKFKETFNEVLANYMADENLDFRLLLIPGDLFEYPWVNNAVIFSFFNEISKYKDKLRVIISSGNHDVSSIRKPTTLEMLSSTINITKAIEQSKVTIGNDIDIYEIASVEKLPIVNIVTEKPVRFILEQEHLIIDALPYEANEKGLFSFNRKQKDINIKVKDFKKILMCHGSIEGFDIIFEEKDLIPSSIIRGYDYILKGHIHKTYILKENNIYSTGSLNRMESSDECSYNIIDFNNNNDCNNHDNNDGNNHDNCYDNNDDNCYDNNGDNNHDNNDNKYDNGIGNNNDSNGHNNSGGNSNHDVVNNYKIPSNLLVTYKLFENETEESINETLDSLTENDVVMIYYSGRSEAIDQKKYYRCFHDCIKFAFIFNNSIIRGKNVISSDSGKFKSFYNYMDDFIAESKVSDSIEKLYNDIKSNLNI